MNYITLTVFTSFLLAMHFILKYLSGFYALDEPDHRKHHSQAIPQIGGLVFASVFIIVGYFANLFPVWFAIGSFVSLLLGVLDDNFDVGWSFKLFIQLSLVCFLSYTFWDRFAQVSFYQYIVYVSQPSLLAVFIIWFVGIYNAVNLLDGLDGLAGGFMVLVCFSTTLLGDGSLTQVTLLLAILLLVFLVFNQRPSRVFMGDAGSLFLGFFVAVLPLLYMDLVEPTSTKLNMTPFVIIVSFLVADTTRVFFTRLLTGRSPMTADTIHFHHLVIQRSGSYLATLFMIFLVTLISALFSILSNLYTFNQTGMLVHLTLLFLFILTPPAPTYVNFITRLVKPVYTWQINPRDKYPQWPHLILVASLLFLLLCSLLIIIEYSTLVNSQLFLSFVLLSFFIYLNFKDKLIIPALQIFITLFLLESAWTIELSIFSNLFALLLLIALGIFTAQRVTGTEINHYSTLDLLVFFITLGVLLLSVMEIFLNPWLFLVVFAIWFSIGFILRRTLYYTSTT